MGAVCSSISNAINGAPEIVRGRYERGVILGRGGKFCCSENKRTCQNLHYSSLLAGVLM